MDLEKVVFLFGSPPPDADLDDRSTRRQLLRRHLAEVVPSSVPNLAVVELIADQIALDEPPAVWRTARRLLARGLGADEVMRNLALAAVEWVEDVLAGEDDLDEDDLDEDELDEDELDEDDLDWDGADAVAWQLGGEGEDGDELGGEGEDGDELGGEDGDELGGELGGEGEDELDDEGEGGALYGELLDSLPLPPHSAVLDALVDTVRERRVVAADDLADLVSERLTAGDGSDDGSDDGTGSAARRRDPAAGMLRGYLEQALDDLVDDVSGPLLLLADDEVVDLPSLIAGATLTHVLTSADAEQKAVPLAPDLLALGRLRAPIEVRGEGEQSALGELAIEEDDRGRVVRLPAQSEKAPPGGSGVAGVAGLEAGLVVAFRLAPAMTGGSATAGSEVDVELLGGAPSPEGELVEWARAAYERELANLGVPVFLEDLLARLLLDHPDALEHPTAPFGELLEAAGLEVRGDECAHDESVWRNGRRLLRHMALTELLEDPDDQSRALEVLEVFDEATPDTRTCRAALEELAHEHVLLATTAVLLEEAEQSSRAAMAGAGPRAWEDALGRIGHVAQQMVQAARRPSDGAPARLIVAAVEEARGDAEAAEAQLELAHEAEPGFELATDRLAWYASDRGDAARALRLLREAGARGDEPKLAMLRRYASPPGTDGAATPGRNDPCWCGSGRKFKHCHLGQPIVHPLAERFEWLYAKAVDFLERHVRLEGEEVVELTDLTLAWTGGDDRPEAIDEAFAAPFVIDVALHEGRWLARFLAARGVLLPEDEARLAETWTRTARSLYEVVAVGSTADGSTADGSTADGSTADGSTADGSTADGSTADGSTADGGTADGDDAGDGAGDSGRSYGDGGATIRDRRSGETIEVRTTNAVDLATGELWCGRVTSDGRGRRLDAAFRVPPAREATLREVLDRGDAVELVGWAGALATPLQQQIANRATSAGKTDL